MIIMGPALHPNRPFGPDDVKGYTQEVQSAMKLLEPLLQSGYLALHPDQWQGGKLAFLRPKVAKRQGWLPPGVQVVREVAQACHCPCCPKGRGG
ncbi:hypothetical protein [Pseudomonas putida]|uniref:Uncharacterized protein n=1 Tax=Pseudomonas putida TaxID=303 RepID=A0A6S5TEY1_PSEPU|nr:hypothetical protein [Pseudomonas putida]BBT38920.1 hypothetical protein WP8W18C01_12610 [Pseudomonas putida]